MHRKDSAVCTLPQFSAPFILRGLILEDLHWTDPSTLEVLDLLIAQVPTASMMVFLTCRPEFDPPWGLRSHLIPIALNRFTRSQVEGMVARITEGKCLPAEVIQQIVEKTDGVPLFVEELTKSILESGVLQETNGHYTLPGPVSSLAIPTTLQDSLMARLDRLDTAKSVAQLGATIGRQFAYALLHAVSPLDEETLQGELGRLVEAELVYQRGVGSHATYSFKHALIQDAAYQSLLKSTRQQYHQRIAQILEGQFPETVETRPELLARHYTEASCYEKAVSYWRRAGTKANAMSAYQEAVNYFEQALDALQHLPECRDTQEQAIDLRLALRGALVPLYNLDRELNTLREAETLANALDDPYRLGRVARSLTHCLWLTGDLEQALTTGQRAMTHIAAIEDDRQHCVIKSMLARIYFSLGQYGKAIETLGQNVDTLVFDRLHENVRTAHHAVIDLRWLAQSCAETGGFTESMIRGEEAVRIAEVIDHPYSLSIAYVGAGYLYLCKGDVTKAIAFYRRGLDVCQRWDIEQLLDMHAIGLSVALSLAGQVTEALELLEQTVRQYPPARLVMTPAPCASALSLACGTRLARRHFG